MPKSSRVTQAIVVTILVAVLAGCGGDSGSTRSLSGSYFAGTEDDGLSIQFQPGRKVEFRVLPGITRSYGHYKVEGDRVSVTIPGGESMVLTIKGNTLEGTVGGRQARFVRG